MTRIEPFIHLLLLLCGTTLSSELGPYIVRYRPKQVVLIRAISPNILWESVLIENIVNKNRVLEADKRIGLSDRQKPACSDRGTNTNCNRNYLGTFTPCYMSCTGGYKSSGKSNQKQRYPTFMYNIRIEKTLFEVLIQCERTSLSVFAIARRIRRSSAQEWCNSILIDKPVLQRKYYTATYIKDNHGQEATFYLVTILLYITGYILAKCECISERKRSECEPSKEDKDDHTSRKDSNVQQMNEDNHGTILNNKDTPDSETEAAHSTKPALIIDEPQVIIDREGNTNSNSPTVLNAAQRIKGEEEDGQTSLIIIEHIQEDAEGYNEAPIINEEEVTDDAIASRSTGGHEADDNVRKKSFCDGFVPNTKHPRAPVSRVEGYANQDDEVLCKICYMEEISIVFLPCSHMVACECCSRLLRRCAVCRSIVKAMIKAEIK